MGAVCSSSRTLGGIVKCRIYRRTSQRTCQIFMFAPELEKTRATQKSEPPGEQMCDLTDAFSRFQHLRRSSCANSAGHFVKRVDSATLAQAGRLFNLKPSSSLRGPPPSPRIDPKAYRRAGPGLGGANVAVADYTTTGRLTDGLVNC